MRYAELHCTSNFSFLQGASHPEELVRRAAELDYEALGLTDRDSLAGVVRMHLAAKAQGLRVLVGAQMSPLDAAPVLLYAMDRAGYGRLARLISLGRRRMPKGQCRITFQDVADHAAGLIAVVLPPEASLKDAGVPSGLGAYREVFADRAYLAAELYYGPDDAHRLERLQELAWRLGMPLVAAGDVHYHVPERRYLQDVLTCIREHGTLAEAGMRLHANAEHAMRPIRQIARLFARCPGAVERTVELADRCRFCLDELRYEYPEALCPAGMRPIEFLAKLTWKGAYRRFGQQLSPRIRRLIEHELRLIEELHYEAYFLTVWDLVRFARSRNILCQGRGSAANSAVCYCLGITAVDPDRIDVLFERFVSRERNEPPDIDVDFEHEQREQVLQYIYRKYGRQRAGMVAEVITYRPRSAVRDVGKALGLSLGCVDALAKRLEEDGQDEPLPPDVIRRAGLAPSAPTIRWLRVLVRQLVGFPRHLSQHVGGMVITRGPLCELVPIENAAMPARTVIQWDKHDIEALGILKVDCLGLGMLTCLHKGFELIRSASRPGTPGAQLSLQTVPPEDPAVYEMIRRADTLGVFQIESRAQMSMLPRLQPRSFYDLVIQVAIVRPGPIQGNMVHPYLRRRSGQEPVRYPNAAIEQVLGKTLGVPLFQEQVMRLAVVAAGFTPGQADQLRRAMGVWRRSGMLETFRKKLLAGMLARGLPRRFAEQTFQQIRGFGEYGFPESHAASFALLVYVSAWLKRYYPAAYAAALLNSQPMGFYAPAQIVRDAQQHGVPVRGVDVNFSRYDCALEPQPGSDGFLRPAPASGPPSQWGRGGPAIRLGMRLIKGLSQADARRIEQARRHGPFRSIAELARRTQLSRAVLARLAAADAFRSLGRDRREALWDVLVFSEPLPLFDGLPDPHEPADLPPLSLQEHLVQDYAMTGLSLTAHPIALLRMELDRLGAIPAADLATRRHGSVVRVAGLVLVRQRPATARGIVFATIEDETATANLVIPPQVYRRYRLRVGGATAWLAEGRLDRAGRVVHVRVERLADLSETLGPLRSASRDFR